jgi:large subunit ribosomal protein L25
LYQHKHRAIAAHHDLGPKARKENIMAEENTLTAESREKFGKGAARKLRAVGKVPAVIYGHGTDPVHVALPAHDIALMLRKANAILRLDLEGTMHLTLVKDVQKDPVRQIIEHLDLIVVRQGERVQVEVPVHLNGEPFSGTLAVLDVQTITLQAEATHIPENIVLDIEGAEEGTQYHAKDIALPTGSVLAGDENLLIASIIALPVARDEDADAAAAGAAE